MRGDDPEFVFTYQGHSVTRIDNIARQRAPKTMGLAHFWVRDFKYKFGRRLGAAGEPLETRKVSLGHRYGEITMHLSGPELEELIEAVKPVCSQDSPKGFVVGGAKKRAATV